ncbi:MAG: TonB-dependent receptor [Dysgonamonadaceae bacterium]|jgi:iron complex outermembrane receptor protein|nr:TonB-dependent receptor [Dysgonamonadaceae bacterium]
MKKVFLSCAVLTLFGTTSIFGQAQPDSDSLKNIKLEEVVVSATRAGKQTPMAYNDISAADIKKANAARNLPQVLLTLPSLVATSEDGLGTGYSSLRIRGTDATRINVTLNGMPLNNPESQEVYWVNLPDLSNSLQSVQVQRGIGTSTNGAAAFGASISMKTFGARPSAYSEASTSIGSYNTYLSTIAAGTGLLKNGLSFDARYSRVAGDGYVRNGKVNHKNLYLSASHYTDRQLLQLTYINGIQHTGITWEGVTKEQMQDEEYGRRYNPSGEYSINGGNRQYYDNETDNYYSNILQFLFTRELNRNLSVNANLSYNHGYGYYENWKSNQKFKSKFGFEPQVVDGVTYTASDVVRRKLMENDFYVANLSFKYEKDALQVQSGALFSYFDGSHFGTLPWVRHNENISPDARWYDNTGAKNEISVFAKAQYSINEALSVYGDVQGRFIRYKLTGIDDDFADLASKYDYKFFNPKMGLFYNIDTHNSAYASIAIGNREPLRTDLKDSKKNGENAKVKPERLFDYELGYKYDCNGTRLGVNLYYMAYDNQLVQTGKLTDTGYKLMENVKDSYRAGVELEAGIPILQDKLRFDANATFSRNKIKKYTAYYDVIDASWDVVGQISEDFKSTGISFAPSAIAAGIFSCQPTANLSLQLIGKYVGRQYLDNTSDKDKSLDPFFMSNFALSYAFKPTDWGAISLDFFANNLFNEKYESNGYASTTVTDGAPDKKENYVAYFPQATRNYMARLTIKF